MVTATETNIKDFIRTVPDFPKKGIMFKDITTLLHNSGAFKKTLDLFYAQFKDSRIEQVAGIEARGFILGSALADRLGAGFVPIRKPDKLPSSVLKESYELEYGTDSLEIHTDAIKKGERILVFDDLLATGGTSAAACRLVTSLGGNIVSLAFLVELTFLHGREKLGGLPVYSIVSYNGE
jgi:adenine phosphoribosyltransferase